MCVHTQKPETENTWDSSDCIMWFVKPMHNRAFFLTYNRFCEFYENPYERIKWFSAVVCSTGTKKVLFTGNKRDSTKAGQQGCGSLREKLRNSLGCTVRHSSFVSILWCANNVVTNTPVKWLIRFSLTLTSVSVSFKLWSFIISKPRLILSTNHTTRLVPNHSSVGASTSSELRHTF